MSTNQNRIQELIAILFSRYVNRKSSNRERKLVEKIYDSIGKEKNAATEDLHHIKSEIKFAIDQRINHRKNFILNKYKYLSAAVILIVIGFSFYIFNKNRPANIISQENKIVLSTKKDSSPILSVNDDIYEITNNIPKGTSFQTIDDEKILNLINLDPLYSETKISISNPCKEPISVLLQDGSQVWLNYKSSLKFEFDKEKNFRIAWAEGEVFFDVKKMLNHNLKVPFKVITPLQTIEVLGTKFNINTVKDYEESVELLEGSIRLSHILSHYGTMLQPGQKAFLTPNNSKILVINSKNDEKAKAWRKGLFYFEEESISAIAQELSNWYEMPIIVNADLNNLTITAMIKRYEKIDQVLELIELTNNIKTVKMKGKIYVLNK